MKNTLYCLIITLFVLSLTSCQRSPQKRAYEEIEIAPMERRQAAGFSDPHAGLGLNIDIKDFHVKPVAQDAKISWTVPAGWTELKGSGLRLATLSKGDVECSIVTLGGQAGGVKANVVRWMRQLNLDVFSDAKIDNFLKAQETLATTGNFKATIIDLTSLQEGNDNTVPSMIASIIETDEFAVFLKLTGPKQKVIENKSALRAITQSIK